MAIVTLYDTGADLLRDQPVDSAGAGSVTLIAAVAGKSIRIHKILLVTAADDTLTFKSDTTALAGAMGPLRSITLDFAACPWFTTNVGEAFVVAKAAVQLSGTIIYSLR